MRKILLYILFLLFYQQVLSQQIFRSTEGDLMIRLIWNDKPLIVQSTKLQMFFDYETAAFLCVLDLGTVTTNYDSLNDILKMRSGTKATYAGKLGLPYINTGKNGFEYFEVEGRVAVMNRQTFLRGTGILEHLYEGTNYTAMVNLTFHSRFSDLTFAPPLPNLFNEFHMEIAQAVLRKDER